jgi:hypothetical protein
VALQTLWLPPERIAKIRARAEELIAFAKSGGPVIDGVVRWGPELPE